MAVIFRLSSLASQLLQRNGYHLTTRLIVPTLCVGMQPVTLRVTSRKRNAERP